MVIGVSLVAFAGCKGGGGSSDVVATVNGVPITQAEYLRYMMLKPSVQVQSSRGPVDARLAEPIGFQALNDLVRQKILVQMAKDQGVYPTDDQITKEIQFQVEGDPNFVKRLSAQGLDTAMIKNALAVQMAQNNLITKGITVTPDEVDKYIAANPDKFTQPPSLDLDWILVHSEAAKKQADDDLRRGQPFEETAMRFSEATNAKDNKGAMPYHHLSELPKELQGPIGATEPLKSTDWIKASDGWAKFYVVRKTPATKVPITDHIKELVKRQIAFQRGANAAEIGNQIQDKLKTSSVDIKLSGLQDTWDQYMKALQLQTGGPSLEKAVQGSSTGVLPGSATGGAPGASPATAGATTGK